MIVQEQPAIFSRRMWHVSRFARLSPWNWPWTDPGAVRISRGEVSRVSRGFEWRNHRAEQWLFDCAAVVHSDSWKIIWLHSGLRLMVESNIGYVGYIYGRDKLMWQHMFSLSVNNSYIQTFVSTMIETLVTDKLISLYIFPILVTDLIHNEPHDQPHVVQRSRQLSRPMRCEFLVLCHGRAMRQISPWFTVSQWQVKVPTKGPRCGFFGCSAGVPGFWPTISSTTGMMHCMGCGAQMLIVKADSSPSCKVH